MWLVRQLFASAVAVAHSRPPAKVSAYGGQSGGPRRAHPRGGGARRLGQLLRCSRLLSRAT